MNMLTNDVWNLHVDECSMKEWQDGNHANEYGISKRCCNAGKYDSYETNKLMSPVWNGKACECGRKGYCWWLVMPTLTE